MFLRLLIVYFYLVSDDRQNVHLEFEVKVIQVSFVKR